MDAERLATRLREILDAGSGRAPGGRTGGSADGRAGAPADEAGLSGSGQVGSGEEAEARAGEVPTAAELLGLAEFRGAGGRCQAVERRHEGYERHGRATIEAYATGFARHAGAVGLVAPELSALIGSLPAGLLFFDLETTGLAGGAGTYAFLVGCGWFEDDTFVTRQYFLPDYDVEDAVLAALAERVAGASAVVTYNGRAFDVPLIDTRYQLNRIDSPFPDRPHLDMLPPARRLWRRRDRGAVRRPGGAGSRGSRASRFGDVAVGAAGETSCSLTALEARVLKLTRVGDVPGAEIPARYFHYLRSRDASMLVDVFEHNRLDLVSLAALTSVALGLVDGGPGEAPSAGECVAIGRMYERAGRLDEAEACFRLGAGLDARPFHWDEDEWARVEALYLLARRLRGQRRYAEAADAWWRLVHDGPCPPTVAREAVDALAIHHEHRERDLEAARSFALRALDGESDPTRRRDVRHRLDRLERKLAAQFGWSDEAGTP